jgi:hypothetical protein
MKKTEAKLTEEEKKAILSRIEESPKNVSESLGLNYNQVRYFMWNEKQVTHSSDMFNCCPITGFKKW